MPYVKHLESSVRTGGINLYWMIINGCTFSDIAKYYFIKEASGAGGGIGRRWGLKIPCPMRACGFESRPAQCKSVSITYTVRFSAAECIPDWVVL